MYEINIIHSNGKKDCLGYMEEHHVTYNRYNEGLLIGAGKLHNSDMRREVFIEYGVRYRNKAELEFRGKNRVFTGTFCFINFIPEIHTVVFGSIGPVREWCPVRNRPLTEEDVVPDKTLSGQSATTA